MINKNKIYIVQKKLKTSYYKFYNMIKKQHNIVCKKLFIKNKAQKNIKISYFFKLLKT